MVVTWPYGFEIDFFRGNPISDSAARFFMIILKFFSTQFLEIKIFDSKDMKKVVGPKKNNFRSPIFINQYRGLKTGKKPDNRNSGLAGKLWGTF